MTKWQIYFWEPVVSPHKLDLFNALAASEAVDATTYVAQEELFEHRRAEGWTLPDYHEDRIVIAPSKARIHEIISASSPESIHLFSGIHWIPCIVEGIAAAISASRRFAIMTEPRASEGFKGKARFVHSWLTERHIRANADFILAIGRNGPPWFRSTGYASERIFPFAYFVAGISPADFDVPLSRRPARLTWLARTIGEKGIHLFLDSLPLISSAFTVEAAGTGTEAYLMHQTAAQMPDRFTYHGAIPMGMVPELLGRTDILVLPSITTNDGWGEVVGEALMAGAAVVATDKVGASICLDNDWRGRTVHNLNGLNIADAIDSLIDDGRLTASYRERRSNWANARLTGAAGADYLLAVLNHVYGNGSRPPPFYAD